MRGDVSRNLEDRACGFVRIRRGKLKAAAQLLRVSNRARPVAQLVGKVGVACLNGYCAYRFGQTPQSAQLPTGLLHELVTVSVRPRGPGSGS